jgi:hypothetical protein
MTGQQESIRSWLGLCPKSPMMKATPAVLMDRTGTAEVPVPDGSRPVGRPGRIRDGFCIAASSLKALVRDRHLLGFMSLAGLIMLFLVLVEGWSNRYIDPVFPATILIWDRSFYVSLQYLWVGIPLGNSHVIFFFGHFLVELVCISGFIFVLGGLIVYRNGTLKGTRFTVRGALVRMRTSFGSLAALSAGLAFIATLVWEIISFNQVFGSIISSIMQLFWIPYAYYAPQNWTLGDVYSSAYFYSLEIMAINILLFLAALYLVPAIVLEKKGLIPAISGSITLMKRTWREVLGCLIVFGLIAVGMFAIGVLIGQSPTLLNHDYDFFLSPSRGYLPMMAVCYGFIVACWVLMAAGFTAAGVALADLYSVAKTGQKPHHGETASPV